MAQSNNWNCFGVDLHFGLINLNHSHPATALINQDITKNLEVLCITEPYYSDVGIANFSLSFTIIANKHKTRSAIIITIRNINFIIITQLRDITAISIYYNNCISIFLNIYSPPSGNFNDIIDLLESYLVKNRNEHVIITGDFNAKHDLWGKQRCDNRRMMLIDLMAKHHIYLVNDNSNPPTYFSTLGQSWIDLVMLNEHADARRITNFRINDDVQLSDHRLITFDIHFDNNINIHAGKNNIQVLDGWKFTINIRNLLTSMKNLDNININDIVIILDNGIRNIYNNAGSKNNKKKKKFSLVE